MGIVYEVWDPVLRRKAALKMLPRSGPWAHPFEGGRLVERFHREARVLAQLKHEHIVPVFGAGLFEGRPYFVMEHVAGGNLSQRRHTLAAGGPKAVVAFMEKVARAVHHAHTQGILHRDLKPANILVDESGQPHVADFSLAKLLIPSADEAETALRSAEPTESSADTGGTSNLTAPGVRPGTPAYMAPEQFDAAFGPIGPAADVWALGIILYDLLTGGRPFRGETREEMQQAVCRSPVPRPRSVLAAPDRRLEAIILRCLEKDPVRRFSSAGELAGALARWQGRGRRRAWIAAAVILVSVVLLGVLRLTQQEPARRDDDSPVKRDQMREELYQQNVAPLLARLQREKKIDLIEPGGVLPPYRIRCGEGITKVRMTKDGMVVDSQTLGIVELLPRVPLERYRIVAEVRHDSCNLLTHNLSGTGVVFTVRGVTSPVGKQHIAGLVSFNDWFALPDGAPNGKEKRMSRVRLHLLWQLESAGDDSKPNRCNFFGPPNHMIYYSASGVDKPVRRITIDVEPGQRTCLWEDTPRFMGPLLAGHLDEYPLTLEKTVDEVHGIDFKPVDQPIVGIMMNGGQCTVKRLSIVPK
jgi:serine/threonine protein kinase